MVLNVTFWNSPVAGDDNESLCLFVLQRAGLLRLSQCKRSLPEDLWPVGHLGSPDPETQRGFAGETGRERDTVFSWTEKKKLLSHRGVKFLINHPLCYASLQSPCALLSAEIITHVKMKVFSCSVRGCEGTVCFSGLPWALEVLESLWIWEKWNEALQVFGNEWMHFCLSLKYTTQMSPYVSTDHLMSWGAPGDDVLWHKLQF